MSTCDICFEIYTSSRKPYVIPCGHTFCEGCLRGLVRGRILTCAQCRKEFPADFSKFTVNFALISKEEVKANMPDNKMKSNQLEHDIQMLEEISSNLERTGEEYLNYCNTSESELNSCIESLIHALTNTKTQLMHKIEQIRNSNNGKLVQYKRDIQSSIAVRRRVLKGMMESERLRSPLDISTTMDLNTLKDLKPISFKLQKVEYDHLITLMSSNISENLTKNLVISEAQISLGMGQNRNEYPNSVVRTDIEDRGSSYAPSNNVENFRANWADMSDSSSNSHQGQRIQGGRWRGRGRGRGDRGRRFNNRHPRGGNLNEDGHSHEGSAQNINEIDNHSDISAPDSRRVNNQRYRGRHENRGHHEPRGRFAPRGNHAPIVQIELEETKIQIPQRAFEVAPQVSTEQIWYILLGPERRRLPNFVCSQINKYGKKHKIVKIFKEGKIINFADLNTMKYYQADEAGNRSTSGHDLVSSN